MSWASVRLSSSFMALAAASAAASMADEAREATRKVRMPSRPMPAAVAITKIATLPPTRSCVSRRKFPIRLRGVKASKIVRAQIKLNGKQVRTVKGKALALPINLRGLPKGRFVVEIVTTDAAGKRLAGKRTYRTCAPKKR